MYTRADIGALTETINAFKDENSKKKLNFPDVYTDVKEYKRKYLGIADVVLAVENSRIDGFAVGHQRNTHENYWIEILYVRPETRGHGAAVEILKKLAEIARNKGYKRIQSRVSKENPETVRLHLKLGYNKGKYDDNAKRFDEFYLMTQRII